MCVLFALVKLAQWAHFLLAGGAAGKRAALPNARVMIHQPLGGFRGQASDIQIHAQEILKIKQTLNERLAFHTGQSIERIEKTLIVITLCRQKKQKLRLSGRCVD